MDLKLIYATYPSLALAEAAARQMVAARLEHAPISLRRKLIGQRFSINKLEGDSPIRLFQSDRIAL